MSIDNEGVKIIFLSISEVWQENLDLLSDIDSKFGDGDHGITIGKIAGLMSRTVENWSDESIKDFIESLSMGIIGISGGSAGPLYGTLVEGLAIPLDKKSETIDPSMLKAMLQGSLDAMREITKAEVGDKTMMDALIPAVEAAQAAEEDINDIIAKAAQAANIGAENSANMVSKFGRARSYGDKTIGTRDAGAVSTALLFEGISRGADRISK